MKKIILILACLLALGVLCAQDTTKVDKKEHNCLFGYVSEIESEFQDVQLFITDQLGLKIIEVCDAENLIFVKLNKEYKDYTTLFAKIEKRFNGECFYKSSADVIIYWDKCRDVFLKKKEKEQIE